jgi:hypothetical protein
MQPKPPTSASTRTAATTATRPDYWRQAAFRVQRHRSHVTGTAALALALIAGSCGGHASKITLPSTTPPAAPSSSSASASASSQTAKDAVIAAYTGYLTAVNKAILAPPEQTRPILRDYATGAYLDFEVHQVAVHRAAREEPWGKVVTHVTNVELASSSAKVHDCQDASNAGLADQRTHRLIPNSRGTATNNLIADMTLGSDSRWRVASLNFYRTACHVS